MSDPDFCDLCPPKVYRIRTPSVERGGEIKSAAGRKGARLLPWIEQMKPFIPSQAYYGALGWAIAKGVAVTKPLTALRYYLNAVLRGCYKPRLAAIIFLQIFLPDGLYRRIADRAIPFVPRRGVSA